MVRILLADEMDLVTGGARGVLTDHTEWQVIGENHTLDDTLHQLAMNEVDIVLCGEHLDPAQDALSLAVHLRTAMSNGQIILIGSARDGLLIRDLLECGIAAYLHRGDPLRECLPTAVRTVLRNSLYLSPTASAEYLIAMRSSEHYERIDDEARAVLRLLAQGCTVGSIAAQLRVNPRRVYWVREKLRRRFGATTNEHLISRAAAEGFSGFAD